MVQSLINVVKSYDYHIMKKSRRQKEENPEMDIDLDIYKTVGQAHFHHTNARVAEQNAAHQ